MPTPKTWTDRAADILLDERNKRYLGMTDRPTGEPQTAAGRALQDRTAFLPHEHICPECGCECRGAVQEIDRLQAAADPSGLSGHAGHVLGVIPPATLVCDTCEVEIAAGEGLNVERLARAIAAHGDDSMEHCAENCAEFIGAHYTRPAAEGSEE